MLSLIHCGTGLQKGTRTRKIIRGFFLFLFFLSFLFLLLSWNRISLCSPNWPWTYRNPPASASECRDSRCAPLCWVCSSFTMSTSSFLPLFPVFCFACHIWGAVSKIYLYFPSSFTLWDKCIYVTVCRFIFIVNLIWFGITWGTHLCVSVCDVLLRYLTGEERPTLNVGWGTLSRGGVLDWVKRRKGERELSTGIRALLSDGRWHVTASEPTHEPKQTLPSVTFVRHLVTMTWRVSDILLNMLSYENFLSVLDILG